jgi:glycosyltransferase involved in cell wall biosynthesis
MKIAVVTYALEVGGVEAFIKHIADYFVAQGHEVVILETLKRGTWSKSFSDSGRTVRQILPRFYNSRIQHAKAIAEILSSFDLVILNDAPYAQAGLGLLGNDAVVITVLHNDMEIIISNSVANSRNWDALVAVSPKLLTHVSKEFAVGQKVFCVSNGVPINRQEIQNDLKVRSSNSFRLTYIGSMNHSQKGVFYLPEIFKRVESKFPNIQMNLIGDGSDVQELKRRFHMMSIDKIHFYGHVENATAMEILKVSDVLIMPSHFEGLPIVLLEAMSAGVVPVTSLLPGITDFVITDKEDGRLIGVGNVDGFADAIVELANCRGTLKDMADAARSTVSLRFSCEAMGKRYLDLAAELFASKKLNGFRRSGEIDSSLLGDFPYLPILLIRSLRKVLRVLRLYGQSTKSRIDK